MFELSGQQVTEEGKQLRAGGAMTAPQFLIENKCYDEQAGQNDEGYKQTGEVQCEPTHLE